MVVGVDKTGRDEAAVGIDGATRRRLAPGKTNAYDETRVDRDPTARKLRAPVHGRYELRTGDDEVNRASALGDGLGPGHGPTVPGR